MKILIVDDSKVTCIKLKKIYESVCPDATIFLAHDSKDAETLIRKIDFDFASIDLNLPGKNGLELIDVIKKRLKDCKVVLITANRQEAIEEKAERKSVDLITKPLDPEEQRVFTDRLKTLFTEHVNRVSK